MRNALASLLFLLILTEAAVPAGAQSSGPYPGAEAAPSNGTSAASSGPELRWNVYTRSWEFAPTRGVLLYNSHERVYQFASPNASLRYNTYTRKYEYAPPGSELKYNSYENTWQFAPSDAYLRQNPYTKRWQWVY